MRTRVKTLGLLVAATTMLGGSAVRADHGADEAGWLEQAGNGSGSTLPALPNFNVGTVLYDANRFPIGTTQRPSWPKFLAWGTVPGVDLNNSAGFQLAMSGGGDDALNWSRPSPAFIRDQNGNDVPFILNHHGGFDIVNQTFINYPFIIVYRVPAADPFSRGQSTPPANTVDAVHVAVSEDGVHWFNDRAIEELVSTGDTVIDGAAATGFKRGIDAPSDLIVNPTGSTTCTAGTPAVNFPWNCRFVMVYTAIGDGGQRSIALAGTGGLSGVGAMIFRGRSSPVLTTGTTWDADVIGHAHIRRTGTSFEMTYSGAVGAPTCVGGTMPCYDLGQATSADGLAFLRANPTRPMTPRSLLDQFNADQPSSLVNAQVVGPPHAGHIRAFYTRMTSTDDMFQAFTSPEIDTAPRLRIGMPDNGVRTTASTPIELYLGDDLGTNIGIDAPTLDLRIDGIPVGDLGASFALTPTIVGTYFERGWRVSSTGAPIRLPDGPHSFSATVRDLDGELGQISTQFVVDTTPPDTDIVSAPSSPALGPPLASTRFTATTVDAGSRIQRVRALVTNPLGLVKVYDSIGGPGFSITENSPTSWSWAWVAPSLDPHMVVPGEYIISLRGVDAGGAGEAGDADNTVRILVI